MSQTILIAVLALIALGAVAFPLLAGRERYTDQAAFEADLRRYREALREGTLCEPCKTANPPGSRFCGECGRPLE
jgi:hypothetical protein